MRRIYTTAFLFGLVFALTACATPGESTATQTQSPPQFTKIDAPLTLDGTKPGTDIPRGSVVYHWANGITEVYGPDNNRIFIAKDSEAAVIPHPTPPGGGGSPGPATFMYQVPSGTSIGNDAKEGNDTVTKMYLGNRLILTMMLTPIRLRDFSAS